MDDLEGKAADTTFRTILGGVKEFVPAKIGEVLDATLYELCDKADETWSKAPDMEKINEEGGFASLGNFVITYGSKSKFRY